MSTVQEIEEAIKNLPPEQFGELRAWFVGLDSKRWDAQFEVDAQTSRLDSLASEALADLYNGRCTDL